MRTPLLPIAWLTAVAFCWSACRMAQRGDRAAAAQSSIGWDGHSTDVGMGDPGMVNARLTDAGPTGVEMADAELTNAPEMADAGLTVWEDLPELSLRDTRR